MHSRALPFFLPRSKWLALTLWLLVATWLGILIYVSSQPPQLKGFHPFPHFDKVLHFVFFGAGAATFGAALRASFAIRWATIFLVVMVVQCGLGLGDEINQLFVTGRSGGDPFDWLADLIGSASGLAVLRKCYANRPREIPAHEMH